MTTPKSLRLVFAALCVLAVSVAGTGVAQAAEEFEPDVLLTSLPGLFGGDGARGVAFDQVTHTVLAATLASEEHQTPAEVKVFPSDGGEAVTVINGLEGAQKTPQGGFAFQPFKYPAGVAVDGSGDVYIADFSRHVVDKFAPVGANVGEGYEYVCQYSGPGRGCLREPEGEPTFGRVLALTVDGAGDLYVDDVAEFGEPESSLVDEFDPAGDVVSQFRTVDHPLLGDTDPIGLAVDGGGDLFIQDEKHQVVELLRDGFSGGVVGEGLVPTGAADVVGITFDLDSGFLLLAEVGRVRAYDPRPLVGSARFEPEFEFATNGVIGENRGGIATEEVVGSPVGDVYVVESATELLDVYGQAPPLRPVVSAESVAAVTSHSAQLSAVVEPELRKTHYVFQFGVDQSYGGGELPLVPGEVSRNQSSVRGSVSLSGLVPGATYHYRVVATNKEGTTYGPDQTFTTFPAGETGVADGRVYEMVSPLDKNGASIGEGGQGAFQASLDGDGVTFSSSGSFGVAQGNSQQTQYLAARSATGWSTQNITPPLKSGTFLLQFPFQAFSDDLSESLLRNTGVQFIHASENPPLPGSGAPPGLINFYLRNNGTGAYRALLTSIPTTGLSAFELDVEGVTPDLVHVVAAIKNAAASVPTVELDEWAGGALVPVNIGTKGEMVAGAVLGSGNAKGTDAATHAISDDGSRVFWTIGVDAKNGSGSEPVFVREGVGDSQPHTVALPPGEFVDADTTGSKVLLSTGEVYDVDLGQEHVLADITDGAGGFEGMLGASDDLSRVYFVDTAVLPGAGDNGFGAAPKSGENNVYLYREGAAPRFIATLAPTSQGLSPDQGAWGSGLATRTSRVTADGETLVFQSVASVTGYDNQDVTSGSPGEEVFVYHATTGALACASCNPTGEQPTGSASIPAGNVAEGGGGLPRSYYQPRVLSADGSRVFFDSTEALVAQDTNGAQDVYEYEDGRVRLISSGTGGPSTFFDASENGENVFFLTANQLVPGDTDELEDLYDARVGGGFPSAPNPPECTGTGCQGVPAPTPIFATPSSGTFNGIGNFPAALAPPVVKPKAKTNAQKLAAALKACKKDRSRSKRATCEKTAHRRYGAAKKSKSKPRSSNKRSK